MRIVFTALLFGSVSAFTQIHDACIWTAAGLNADLTDKLSLGYNTEIRLYKNASTLDSYINEIGLGFKPIKNLSLGFDYRYSRKDQEGYFEGVHRFGAELSYDYKIEGTGIRLKARARYQLPFNYLGVINNAIYPDNRNVLRFKLSVKYRPTNLKLVQPFCSYELYKAVKPKNQFNAIDSYRLVFGATLDLPKRHSVDLYYMLENEFRSAPQVNHIYGIQYNYDLFKDPIIKSKN
ncbi:MAG: DUF2490 domain-containing protein [Crocinitomicaceae bacterium]|nr:DUF2490 domain-containing protein [Crocinitomicaceae bacterium]MBK8927888.1 DUF2490 domain-containing protein [Crocinitomicaceae bacterium]